MSRIPPSLLYLTIYNPTLRPDIPAAHGDDEDVEEQAQILFYTSRDRAVSRDKMLRQVGLAKALVNFAEIFYSTDPCQNVHSQCRRMAMVNPEPNFWMHVAVELARTPRTPTAKPGTRDKGKGKAQEAQSSQVPLLDYHDGTLHDCAIRAHLMRGYEQFKLYHGSFSSILSSLGQQALELQLERFFTVWAWSWDLDKDLNLGMDLGLPLHPSYHLIHPVIEDFSLQIPEGIAVLVLTQNHVAPSDRYRDTRYPVALARHLMNHLTPTPSPAIAPPLATQRDKLDKAGHPEQDYQMASDSKSPPPGGFLGVNITMDVRKWAWLSFGKSPGSKELATSAGGNSVPHTSPGSAETQIDQNALADAIASDNSFGLPAEKSSALDEREKPLVRLDDDSQEVETETDTPRPSRVPSPMLDAPNTSPNDSLPRVDMPTTISEKRQFTWMDVFLAPRHDPSATSRKRVYLLKHDQYAVALLGGDVEDVETWIELVSRLLEEVERIVKEDNQRNMTTSLPSVTKILQPKDRRILRTGDYVNASGEVTLSSDRLFEAKGLLDREPGVIEVFSRGLHPQHWHVASRITDPVEDAEGEAYLEVSRKEATLPDVDNVLHGLYKTRLESK